MNKTSIRIGGVTEHFNLPWNIAVENNVFLQADIDLKWQFFPGGTGVMTEALRSGELDMAILLTEGFLSAASRGLPAKIVKEYITSPLGWGIFTGKNSGLGSVYSRAQKKYAISNLGSGSHLMAMIHAEQRGEKISDSALIEVRSIEGAVESLMHNETNVFYWEKYTTKPFVKSGQLKMIGEFSAPWSSFLIVAANDVLQTQKEKIHAVLEIINTESKRFASSPASVSLLMSRFTMSENDAINWLNSTIWSGDYTIRQQGLENAKQALIKIGNTNHQIHVRDYCANFVELI